MDKVPGLPDEVKLQLRKYIVNIKGMGIHNDPRRFEVCNNIIKHALAVLFPLLIKGKSEKCTVVIATALSSNIQARLTKVIKYNEGEVSLLQLISVIGSSPLSNLPTITPTASITELSTTSPAY